MSEMIAFQGANLPAVQTLSTALRAMQIDVGPSAMVLLKMDKTGHWTFGGDHTEVEDGAQWAVNPFSFTHGWIAWGKGEMLGEKMVPMTQPLPEQGEPPAGAKKGWELQVGFCLKCLTGEDEGMEARFMTNSIGGKKAVQALAVKIAEAITKDQSKPVAVVELGTDSYTHKEYGLVYVPVFEVVSWRSMTGETETEPEPEGEAPATEAPARRRRVG